VRHRTAGAPGFDVVEVTRVRVARMGAGPDRLDALKPVNRWFDKVIDGAAWR